MKRIISLLLIIIMLVTCTAFYASASVYSGSGFRFELPEDAVINNERAEATNSTRSWITEDNQFAVDILIKDNYDKGCYINFSEDDIRDAYYGYTSNHDGNHELISGRNFSANGFEGLRLDMEYGDAEHTVCAFSTDEKVYTVYFYVLDSDYSHYIDQIIDTITIDGKPYSNAASDFIGGVFYIFAIIFVLGAVVYIVRKKPAKSVKKTHPVSVAPSDEAPVIIDSGKDTSSSNNYHDKTFNSIEKF